MAEDWQQRASLFLCGPSLFLSGCPAEVFLAELLRELRDDRAAYSLKVLLLSPLCDQPSLLCPSLSEGEETALELMSVFAQCPAKCVQFRCQLLLALTSVLVCSSCAGGASLAFQDFLELLLQSSQDQAEVHGALRETACDCLRELEACCPGLLSQHLELLAVSRQRETSTLHQAFAGLQVLVLRNAVYQLSQQTGAGVEHVKALLGANTSVVWEAEQDSGLVDPEDPAALRSLVLGPMGTVPTLHTGPDCKELRCVLASLLEESYLLTPLCQAALLHRLIEVVAMVPGVTPSIFRAQLLRLLGTTEVCLLHATLLMKSAFTDSLFSAEDEAFFLKRLVVLSQHALLSGPQQLFFLHCILHFPENRPISCGDSESLPVLLTPRLASPLLPSVLNRPTAFLSRLHLLCLVYLEEGEDVEEGPGLAYLYQQLVWLQRMVEGGGGGRETAVTFFRAAFLFLCYFQQVQRYSSGLTQQLCRLYTHHTRLAPHILNLADQTQDRLRDSCWAVGLLTALQEVVTTAPLAQLSLHDLRCHLQVLSRVAEEGRISQRSSLAFLCRLVASSSSPSSLLCAKGSWRLRNGVLGVCRRLLLHPNLDSMLLPLADVLQQVARQYRDTDVQDHARLYYSLLTTLSRDKLAAVLATGATDTGRLVKKQALSSLVVESEGLSGALTTHQTERPVFKLTEVSPEPGRQREDCGPVGVEADEEVAAALEAYKAKFNHPDFASEIILTYKLELLEGHGGAFDRLFSIRLHFSLSDDHYEELQDVSVPFLFRDRPPPRLQLRLRPRRPRPTTLHASALFTTQDGLTWHAALPDVHVAFRQTFQPLPALGRSQRLGVFHALWQEMASESENGAVSLFCCGLENQDLKAVVEKHLLTYVVADTNQTEEVKLLLFLPPRSHILLKVKSEEDAAHFHIVTDNWQLLPYINSFLVTLCSSAGDAPR